MEVKVFDDYNDGFGDVDSGDFIRFCNVADLKQKGQISKKVIGKWVAAFYRPGNDNEMYAMEMSCKHQGANLGNVKPIGDVVTCPRHFWKYNVVTGKSHTPNSPDLRKHAIRLKEDALYVSIRPMAFLPSQD